MLPVHLQKRLQLPKAALSAQQILVAGDFLFFSAIWGEILDLKCWK